MIFQYNKDKIQTTDHITISVADLRDLIQAHDLDDLDHKKAEIDLIISCILHKNHYDVGDMKVQLKDSE